MEPLALNQLIEESESLRKAVLDSMPQRIPETIKHWFHEHSAFFQEIIIDRWRESGRHEELVDYIQYEFGRANEEQLWSQILLDLRTEGKELLAKKLLSGLLVERMEAYWASVSTQERHPQNPIAALEVAKRRGAAAEILYEQYFLAANKPEADQDQQEIAELSGAIWELVADRRGGQCV